MFKNDKRKLLDWQDDTCINDINSYAKEIRVFKG